ncbi:MULTISPECIES: HNH endonuclease [Pseudoalteromonas]|uniref:HNH domain-containing protein n=1 Tax=Pseudoalteromonas arctica TaxID=394751 RepID=A0AAP6Y0R8_9GAMM|nr:MULTISPECIES: HNH endonuclease [Pseudoalteromonas]MBH0001873.1 HNH endonuclease [Pseudoalteromonas sp. SWYJZ12]MDN3383581.1 HNH endonuclease [Pseudoalteromonas sp. APC 3358]MDQ2045778.1 HNH endonuclease [Pseudoalteromonas sp. 20-92]NMP01680.1 hypothetical protein [Pseudoalteromonas arctica]
MNPDVAKKLSLILEKTTKESNDFHLVNSIEQGVIEGFHTFSNGMNSFGGFLISNGSETLWVLIIDWKGDNNYYLVLYPENNNLPPLAELHKETTSQDGTDLTWSYIPRKKDKKNEIRKELFQNVFGALKAVVSLPNDDVTLDDTLNDLFHIAACRVLADNLEENLNSLTPVSFSEGKRLEKKHYSRERSQALVNRAKKIHAKKHKGELPCEVCEFDFKKKYGEKGALYIEAHHKVPLNELDENESRETLVEDLAMVCANCHRMLHRSPYQTIKELKHCLNAF